MKHNTIITILLASASVFTGCKKNDISPPVVHLTGEATDTISLQGTYIELGATAEDLHQDGLIPIASGTINTNLKGTYTITYTATDDAGNVGTNKRKVTVVNDVDYLEGTYYCTIAGAIPWNYEQIITASSTVNNRIVFGKFSDHKAAFSIYGNITDSVVTIPSQVALQVGTPVADRSFEGLGALTSTGLTLGYSETSNTTVSTNETYTKL